MLQKYTNFSPPAARSEKTTKYERQSSDPAVEGVSFSKKLFVSKNWPPSLHITPVCITSALFVQVGQNKMSKISASYLEVFPLYFSSTREIWLDIKKKKTRNTRESLAKRLPRFYWWHMWLPLRGMPKHEVFCPAQQTLLYVPPFFRSKMPVLCHCSAPAKEQ